MTFGNPDEENWICRRSESKIKLNLQMIRERLKKMRDQHKGEERSCGAGAASSFAETAERRCGGPPSPTTTPTQPPPRIGSSGTSSRPRSFSPSKYNCTPKIFDSSPRQDKVISSQKVRCWLGCERARIAGVDEIG